MPVAAPTCPPIGLAYLAAVLRAAGNQVQVVDAVGEAPDSYTPLPGGGLLNHGLSAEETVSRVEATASVIGVSCMFSHEWPATRSLIESLRSRCPGALIVVGGEHPSALPTFLLADCGAIDVVVRGEGERSMLALVQARHDPEALAAIPGVVTRASDGVGVGERILAVDSLPRPAWDLLPVDAYLDRGLGFGVNRGRSMPILATRGCPYRCTFCSSPSMWTTRWVAREPADVADEISDLIARYGVDNIDFYDMTAIVRRSWIVEFCRLVIDRGLRFTWQLPSGTRSEAIDDEVARLLFASGCRNLSYAPESGSPEVLDRMRKRVDLDRMLTSMRAAVLCGINAKANVMVGLPGETRRDVLRTLRFCARIAWLGLHDLSVSVFSPYPGTELFEQLRADGRIPTLDDDYFWSLVGYSDLTEARSWSEHLSDHEVVAYRLAAMAVFYTVSFVRRPWRLPKVVRNVVWSETQESRLEMVLRQLLTTRRAAARASS